MVEETPGSITTKCSLESEIKKLHYVKQIQADDFDSRILRLQRQIEALELSCTHRWSEAQAIKSTKGGAYGPPETNIVGYKRVCLICGKSETTTKTQETVVRKPVF